MGREERIRDTLEQRPYHELVRGDLYRITDRIRQIDEGYFILRHRISGRYEVHNTNNIGSTYCFIVPYDALDKRTLIHCRETAVQRDVAEIIAKQNDRLTKRKERSYQSEIESRSKYVSDMESFAVNEDQLHEGYKKTHYIARG